MPRRAATRAERPRAGVVPRARRPGGREVVPSGGDDVHTPVGAQRRPTRRTDAVAEALDAAGVARRGSTLTRRRGPGADRDYWDRNATRYDRSMALFGRPIPRMVELARDATRGLGRVLEVAAGTGLVTGALAASATEVVATDYSAEMVAALARRVSGARLSNVRCEQADLYALRFGDGEFDAAVAANVLHLVPDLPGALAELRRVVRPGGLLVAPTYCHAETALSRVVSRALAATGFPGHRRFTSASLRASLEAAGVRIVRAETLPGALPIGYVDGTFG